MIWYYICFFVVEFSPFVRGWRMLRWVVEELLPMWRVQRSGGAGGRWSRWPLGGAASPGKAGVSAGEGLLFSHLHSFTSLGSLRVKGEISSEWGKKAWGHLLEEWGLCVASWWRHSPKEHWVAPHGTCSMAHPPSACCCCWMSLTKWKVWITVLSHAEALGGAKVSTTVSLCFRIRLRAHHGYGVD